MKIRVFKTPSKLNPNSVHIGLPDSLKLDTGIIGVQLDQTEILSSPTSISDLAREPQVIPNGIVDGFKNVGISSLTPGFKLKGTVKGTVNSLQTPLEIEEVLLPSEFDNLEDLSSWHVYNYNSAYKMSDNDFDVLPGDKNLPTELRYNLIIKGKNLLVRHDEPIDNILVYYRRVYKNSELDSYWSLLTTLNKDSKPFEFPLYGEFDIRLVPKYGSKLLASFKETKVIYTQEEEFEWSSIQLSADSYQVRMEGILGSTITEVDIFENNKRISREKLTPDRKGRIETSFRVSGITTVKDPTLELKFYRVNGLFRSLVKTEKRRLYSNNALEPISLKVKRLDSNTFELFISDPENMLYYAVNSLLPFSGADWQRSIQTHKYMAFVSINRHQDGIVTDYGYYPVNVTSGNSIEFLENPPFGDSVRKIGEGFSFTFEDTKKFREIKNIDDPNLEKRIAYEFRLMYWTTGIQECLRTGNDYIFAKEASILVKNKRRSYKYSYSVWKEEHPVKKYEGRIPVDVKYAYLGHHVLKSKSPTGYIHVSESQPVAETKNVLLKPGGWRVLYFYNDKDDEIQTFPYSSFEIHVPSSSQLSIDRIKIYIENSEKADVLLGEFHPFDKIEVVDFLGYYEARKSITKSINVQAAVSDAVSASIAGASYATVVGIPKKKNPTVYSTPSRDLNTPVKKNTAKKNNRQLNKIITETIEIGVLNYRIDVIHKSKKVDVVKHSVNISDIPKLPPEPEDNQSLSIGNKTISPTLQVVNPDAFSNVVSDIKSAKITKTSKIGGRR